MTLKAKNVFKRADPEAFAPVVFVKGGPGYRVYGFDAYLVAGLFELILQLVEVPGKGAVPVLEIHQILIQEIANGVTKAGRSITFFRGEAPAGLKLDLLPDGQQPVRSEF